VPVWTFQWDKIRNAHFATILLHRTWSFRENALGLAEPILRKIFRENAVQRNPGDRRP
jgi:hypothetical protein